MMANVKLTWLRLFVRRDDCLKCTIDHLKLTNLTWSIRRSDFYYWFCLLIWTKKEETSYVNSYCIMYHMARRAPEIAAVAHPQSLGFPPRNIYINDPESTTTATSYYRAPINMNAANTTVPGQQPASESLIDKAYITSIRGILKIACLLFCFVAFICVITTPQCNGNHVFLATVAWLVIIMQSMIIVAFLFRFKTRFPGLDFEFLDFFATAHDTIYLLISSSVTIHYCHNPGQVAGGVMGIFAFIFLAGDAVAIFLARRDDSNPDVNGNVIRT